MVRERALLDRYDLLFFFFENNDLNEDDFMCVSCRESPVYGTTSTDR